MATGLSGNLDFQIARLAVLRELQVNGCADVVTLRQRLNADRVTNAKLTAAIQFFAKSGGLTGEEMGIDPLNHFPYKRWTVTGVDRVKRYALKYEFRLMPPSGKAHIAKA